MLQEKGPGKHNTASHAFKYVANCGVGERKGTCPIGQNFQKYHEVCQQNNFAKFANLLLVLLELELSC